MASYSELIERARVSQNPLHVIRAHCIICIGEGSPNDCTSKDDCMLYPFRMGKNPRRIVRELTQEQREAAVKRLAAMRLAKKRWG